MSKPVIEVNNLGKQYVIGENIFGRGAHTFRDVFDHRLRRLLSRERRTQPANRSTIWALRNASFGVKEGEVLGIIGRNGAGKSTLLKILSRITEPTEGRAVVRGRVASLLEVGTGFSMELTGRENIYLNGAILGMKKGEIDRKFDEIVSFAEVEMFIDTPVKRYSSGMFVRLAFAVAAHLEPEILLVDEVLAVGDAAFQKKCLGKMADVAKGGRTVLFVSHNMRAVNALCRRAVLLEKGRLSGSGAPANIIQSYLMERECECTYKPEDNGEDFVLSEVRLESETGERKTQFFYSEKFVTYITFLSRIAKEWPRAGITLRDSLGEIVFSSGYRDIREDRMFNHVGALTFRVVIPPCWLNIGRYSLDVSAHYPNVCTVFSHHSCVSFSIEEDGQVPGGYGYSREGVLRPRLHWEIVTDGG